jgi:hypothetical protein
VAQPEPGERSPGARRVTASHEFGRSRYFSLYLSERDDDEPAADPFVLGETAGSTACLGTLTTRRAQPRPGHSPVALPTRGCAADPRTGRRPARRWPRAAAPRRTLSNRVLSTSVDRTHRGCSGTGRGPLAVAPVGTSPLPVSDTQKPSTKIAVSNTARSFGRRFVFVEERPFCLVVLRGVVRVDSTAMTNSACRLQRVGRSAMSAGTRLRSCTQSRPSFEIHPTSVSMSAWS